MPKQQSVLLIEDDHLLGRLYVELLADAGYEVILQSTAVDAIVTATEKNVDLILLDVMLPDMNGLEVLQKIGKQSAKTIMISNLDQPKVLREAQRNGAAGYIIKSNHTPDTFLGEVSRMLTDFATSSDV